MCFLRATVAREITCICLAVSGYAYSHRNLETPCFWAKQSVGAEKQTDEPVFCIGPIIHPPTRMMMISSVPLLVCVCMFVFRCGTGSRDLVLLAVVVL